MKTELLRSLRDIGYAGQILGTGDGPEILRVKAEDGHVLGEEDYAALAAVLDFYVDWDFTRSTFNTSTFEFRLY